MRIIGGTMRGKVLISPQSETTRPTSDRLRESLFNSLVHNPRFGLRGLQGLKVLDVFAGTGALGLEALSRGAAHVTFIERDASALKVLKSNIKACGCEDNTTVISVDVKDISSSPHAYDLIFMDPPYNQDLAPLAIERLMTGGYTKPETLWCVEVAKSETPLFPEGFEILSERKMGAGKVYILI